MIHLFLASALTLLDVERAAVTHSPAVTEARAKMAEQEALVAAAQGSGAPHAIASYAQTPQGAPPAGTISQRLTTLGAQMTFGDVIARDALVAQAQADLRSARANERNAERAERVKAITLYYDALRTTEIVSVREAMLQGALADQRAARLRFSAGDAPRLDVVRADVALARTRADLAQARADASNARTALDIETGLQSVVLAPPQALANTLPAILNLSKDDLSARAIAHRPEIVAAREDVASETFALAASHRAILPALTAQAGWTTGIDSGINVSGPNATITLDLPLSGVAAQRAKAQQARLAQARARLDAAVQAVTLEVVSAYETLHAQTDALHATTAARSEAEQELRAAQLGYREGASSSLDLEDARRTYAQAVLDEITAQSALDVERERFALALGEDDL